MMASRVLAVLLCIVCVVGVIYAQSTTVETCADIGTKMNELNKLVDTLCDSPSTPSVQQCNCPVTYNWTSVPITSIGTSSLHHASTISFTIPSVSPSSAKEVLIHAGVFSGYSTKGPYQDLKIFTQIGSTRYEKYLLLYSYSQTAFNTNSDNMWFPMPPNRRVYLTVPAAHGGNTGLRLFAIGYR